MVFYSYASCFMNTLALSMYVYVKYRVNQAEYVIHILVVAPQEFVNAYSTRRAGFCFQSRGRFG